MATSIISRPEGRWRGLDLRTAGYAVHPDAAAELQNIDIATASKSLTRRRGTKTCISSTVGGLGMVRYAKHDNTTGTDSLEKLIVGASLYRITSGTFAIAYTGSGTSIYLQHIVNAATLKWEFTMYEDGVLVLTYVTSVGFDESSIPTLANLKTAVDAVSGFSATITGISTLEPAAVAIPLITSGSFVSNAYSISCDYLVTVNQPASAANPFANHFAARNLASFENATSYNINSVVYINTGTDEQQKYDGQKVYRAGMPAPASTFAVTVGGAGNVDAGAHIYTMFYRQRDKQGNIVEGDESNLITVTTAPSTVTVTCPNIQNTTGFNTDMATVNGSQTGVTTITVTGSTLKVGDPLFFINRATGAVVTNRTVQAGSTSTSLIIDGAAVNVTNGDIITAGLSIVITRSKVGGTLPYVVAEIANNSGTATTSYTDNVADSTLTEIYSRPAFGFDHGLPPKGRYGSVHYGIAVIGGDLSAGDRVYYSLTNPEYWPVLNNFDIRTAEQDSVSGIFVANEFLVIFKQNSVWSASGSLADDDFSVSEITRKVGCSANASITQMPDGSIFFLSKRGPQRIIQAGEPQDIGYPILPLFLNSTLSAEQQLQLKRAVSYLDLKNEKVVLFIPCETSNSGGKIAANENSIVLVLDYGNSLRTQDEAGPAFYLWNNLNMAGGVIIDGDELTFVERRYSGFNGDMAYNVHCRLSSNTVYDYADHIDPIPLDYIQGWETMGAPSVYKLPLRWKLWSQDAQLASEFAISVETNLDYNETANTQFTTAVGSAGNAGGWGLFPWGVSPWNSPQPVTVLKNLKRTRCQAFRMRYQDSTIYTAPVITQWEIEVSTPFVRAMKN